MLLIANGCIKENQQYQKKKRESFKAQLVAKGFSQHKVVDYDEIFSHVVRHTSIRAKLALINSSDLHLEQMNVKMFFCMVI
ncbi:hypothetical protein GQ457_12G029120 [Hibiscus cannabinus]